MLQINPQQSVIRTREDLKFLAGTEVHCSGRVKELRKHAKRKDLDSLCLVNVIVTPLPVGESLYIDHLWVLRKQLTKVGITPQRGKRVFFKGTVYSYKRLGGKSIDRGLYGTEDFGILPVSQYET